MPTTDITPAERRAARTAAKRTAAHVAAGGITPLVAAFTILTPDTLIGLLIALATLAVASVLSGVAAYCQVIAGGVPVEYQIEPGEGRRIREE